MPEKVTTNSITSFSSPSGPSSDLSYVLKSLLAGGLAGCFAKTVIGPFDRVKILFQVHSPAVSHHAGKLNGVFRTIHHIFVMDGIYGLYRGHSAMLMRIFPYAGINFMAYEQYKRLLIPTKEDETPFKKLIAGSLAGSTSVAFTYPFDIMRARLAYHLSSHPEFLIDKTSCTTQQPDMKISSISPGSSSYSFTSICKRWFYGKSGCPVISHDGWMSTFRSLTQVPSPSVNERSNHPRISSVIQSIKSLKGLYRGFTPTLLGIIPYAGVSFASYETLKTFFIYSFPSHSTTSSSSDTSSNSSSLSKPSLSAPVRFICGLLAGALGQTFSYPLDVVRRRMQLDTLASHLPVYPSISSAFRHIIETRGYKGLFIGLSINYLKVAPATAISFITYEYLKELFHIV